ncbi:MAG: class I SAM-dependent methyltransferase [Candidatus Omnitrophica bacterium]|nr:class I SAM-dependent methyltransferase [Candidatus Omnitrophota bacterium]
MSIQKIINSGVKVSETLMSRQDKIWSRYSRDKVDIGETLAKIIRTLAKALPVSHLMRALSIGSSNEPQFRILQTAFQGGLYLLDIEKEALAAVRERMRRQDTKNVFPIQGDFNKIFSHPEKAHRFFKKKLHRKGMELIALQHSMYYCKENKWGDLIRDLYEKLLVPAGAVYCVLMASKSDDPFSTTWLYNHFAKKFCGHTNHQDLIKFAGALRQNSFFKKTQILSKTNRVKFFVNNFQEFMSVIWMILLYPHVHRYTLDQRREIAEYVYANFFEKKKPLFQYQDHLVIYRGIPFKGLI